MNLFGLTNEHVKSPFHSHQARYWPRSPIPGPLARLSPKWRHLGNSQHSWGNWSLRYIWSWATRKGKPSPEGPKSTPKDMNSFQTVPFARKKNAASYQGEKPENAHPDQLESKKQKQERNPCMHRASYGPEKQAHSQVWNISSSSLEILILMTFCFKESKGMRNERLCLIIGWLIISWRWSPETSFSTSVDATGMCEYILPQDLW